MFNNETKLLFSMIAMTLQSNRTTKQVLEMKIIVYAVSFELKTTVENYLPWFKSTSQALRKLTIMTQRPFRQSKN